MLIIDNREEIQQLILNETGSPEATEGILTLLEKQESLSQIYDEYINVSKDHPFFESPFPHSIEEVEMFYTFGQNVFRGQDGKVQFSDKVALINYIVNPELVEQITDTITEGELSYKLNQENHSNASKEEFKTKIKDLLTNGIKKVKIKTSEEDENNFETKE